MHTHPNQDWRTSVSKDPLSQEEKRAYELMQGAIIKQDSTRLSKALLHQELAAGDIDLTTPEGRRKRSKKNLAHLAEAHQDCPDTLLQELTNVMLKKQCTLRHEIWDINIQPETIIQSGMLLSNAELKRRGISVSGGTDAGAGDDRGEFGNQDFVFTWPIFHDADKSIQVHPAQFYIPVDDQFLNHHAWLSFKDWLGTTQDKYLSNKQLSDRPEDARLHSLYYDFFVGKKDISQAIAYKVFEAMKTAIILYTDEAEKRGFNLGDAQTFLNDVRQFPYRQGQVESANTLQKPISHYTLSEKQKSFLLDENNSERNALLSQAFDGILHVLSKAGELKIPVALSLDGATIGSQYLTGDANKPNPRRFSRRKEGQWADAPPESLQVTPISTQLPFERKVGGFECPD